MTWIWQSSEWPNFRYTAPELAGLEERFLRQEKALLRLFREGPKGFAGGLSAENYLRITGASRPTATRDLQDLVRKGALTRTGQLKGTRYHLNLDRCAE